MDLASIRAQLSNVRSQLDTIAADARELWETSDSTSDHEACEGDEAAVLYDTLSDISDAIAELEGV